MSKTPLKLSGNSRVIPLNRETGLADDPKVSTINDWEPEVKSLLAALEKAGCVIVEGSDGEEDFAYAGKVADFIERLTATDEAALYVITPTSAGKKRWLSLIYGNSPGELLSDYTVDATLETVSRAHYTEWDGKPQPQKRGYYDHNNGGKFVVVP